jgi:hypothetical protein
MTDSKLELYKVVHSISSHLVSVFVQELKEYDHDYIIISHKASL